MHLIKARGMAPVYNNNNSDNADAEGPLPYCVVSLGAHQQHQSAVQNSNNPEWDQQFTLCVMILCSLCICVYVCMCVCVCMYRM